MKTKAEETPRPAAKRGVRRPQVKRREVNIVGVRVEGEESVKGGLGEVRFVSFTWSLDGHVEMHVMSFVEMKRRGLTVSSFLQVSVNNPSSLNITISTSSQQCLF